MSVQVESVKCACADCVCVIGVEQGVQKDGRVYCGDNCASHHEGQTGCEHAGCTCHG